MDAVDFIKKFETSYNIPTFEKKPFFVDGSDLSSYIYTSPEGIKITINSCKWITLEKVRTIKDDGASFN